MSGFDCCGGNDETPVEHTMDCDRPFKILRSTRKKNDGLPDTVPWNLILQAGCGADRSKRAMNNHSQTLERLNERGGLSPVEIYAIVNDKKLWDVRGMSEEEGAAWLVKFIEEHL